MSARLRHLVPRLRRYFSPRPLTPQTWPEAEFSEQAGETLEALSESLTEACDALEAFDAEFSQGVLTVRLGASGTYVMNTQTPNRQIWLSSPVSGPYRYYYDADSSEWLCTRDHHRLHDLLAGELRDLHGVELKREAGPNQ